MDRSNLEMPNPDRCEDCEHLGENHTRQLWDTGDGLDPGHWKLRMQSHLLSYQACKECDCVRKKQPWKDGSIYHCRCTHNSSIHLRKSAGYATSRWIYSCEKCKCRDFERYSHWIDRTWREEHPPRQVSQEERRHDEMARYWQQKADSYGSPSNHSTRAWRKANKHRHMADNARKWGI